MDDNEQPTTYRQSLRSRIVETAMRAFASQGVRAVKMDDIAQRLGISKRTLYEVFENKELLLFDVVKTFLLRRENDMLRVVAESANVMDVILYVYKKKIEESQEVSPVFYSDLERYPQVQAFLNAEHERNHRNFLGFMQRGVKEGIFRPDLDYELVGVMFDAVTKAVVEKQLYYRYSIRQIFRDMAFVSLRGICTSHGQKLLDEFSTVGEDAQ